jgi:hypothetical protein
MNTLEEILVRLSRACFLNSVHSLVAVIALTILVTIPVFGQMSVPAEIGSEGYINGTPLTAHSMGAFNSVGSTTLVVFVSTNSPWNSQQVSISGVSDNLGNNWGVLTGPTSWNGNTYPLLSAIYYVNLPATSNTHSITVHLTNPAPLVAHVFAISGSNVTGPPIFSTITNPGASEASAVTTTPITVPAGTLLLSWAKNETGANATAVDGYTLDAGSTSYLWAESETATTAGSYTGDFQYNSSIGWQTAVVGIKPASTALMAFNQATTTYGTTVDITLTAESPSGFPLTYSVVNGPTHGTLSGISPSLSYTPNPGYTGSDAFTFKANDGTGDSNIATVSITVASATQSPTEVGSQGYINTNPQTVHTTGTFNSVGSTTLVAFVSSHSPWNGLPVSINGVTDNLGNKWSVLTGPTLWNGNSYPLLSAIYYVNLPVTSNTHAVTVNLTNPAPAVIHVFAISGSDFTGPPIYSAITSPPVGTTSATVVTAPITVPANTLLLSWAKNETGANATAIDGYTLDAGSTSYLWAESETMTASGSYTGDFQYDSSIGWETAVVGLKPAAAAPTAFNQALTTSTATPVNIILTAVSPSGFPLAYSVVNGPTHGTLSGMAPNLSYTSNSGYVGSDAFTFRANDGTRNSNLATVSITIRGRDHAPVASGASITVAAGTSTAVMLIATDADGDSLTYSVLSSPAHGQLSSGTGSNRIYTPNAGYTGSDSFTFKANDGEADSNVATVSITVAAAVQLPAKIASQGYINGTPLTTHTMSAFNSVGSTTLVAFVSTNTPWNGQPVSISGVSDNLGNNWSVLTGPTSWTGNSYPLLSAIYYVNLPATSNTHTVTVNLTNPAPLVAHVFAISGSDITGPPIYTGITNPAGSGTSASVATAPISVPAGSLLLSWVKNESGANATAIDGYTLDAGSTSYLWAESETATAAGSYTGDFQYDSSIGWQTAVVGLKPATAGPVAVNQTVTTNSGTAVNITLTAESPSGFPLIYSVVNGPTNGTLSGIAPNLTYTPNSGYAGTDAFTFKANDGTGDSNVATVRLTIIPAQHFPAEVGSQGYINGTPLTIHTTAAFNTVGASTLVVFVSTNSPWNGQPVNISGVTDNQGNNWSTLTDPTLWNGNSYPLLSAIYYVNLPATSTTHTVTVNLTNPGPLVFHVFAISGSDITGPPIYSAITNPGSSETSASVTTAPITVPAGTLLLSWAKNETGASATAIDGYTLDAGSTSYLWAESVLAATVGSYTGDFQYSGSIGWQTAIVGLKPAGSQ